MGCLVPSLANAKWKSHWQFPAMMSMHLLATACSDNRHSFWYDKLTLVTASKTCDSPCLQTSFPLIVHVRDNCTTPTRSAPVQFRKYSFGMSNVGLHSAALLRQTAIRNPFRTAYFFWTDGGLCARLPSMTSFSYTADLLDSNPELMFLRANMIPDDYIVAHHNMGNLAYQHDIVDPSFFGGSRPAVVWFHEAAVNLVRQHSAVLFPKLLFSTLVLDQLYRIVLTGCDNHSMFERECVSAWATRYQCNGSTHWYDERKYALVSLLSENHRRGLYVRGVETLGNSLISNINKSTTRMLLMATYTLDESTLKKVHASGWDVCYVPAIKSPFKVPRRRIDQFTKLVIWGWSGFERVVYLDSDMLVLRPISELFTLSSPVAACFDFPDKNFSSELNGGLVSIRPVQQEFFRLMMLRLTKYDYPLDHAEQGFLSSVYKGQWLALDWVYNAHLLLYYTSPDMWRKREHSIKIIHYTIIKPWGLEFRGKRSIQKFAQWKVQPVLDAWLNFNKNYNKHPSM